MLRGRGWQKIKIPEDYLVGPPEFSYVLHQPSVF